MTTFLEEEVNNESDPIAKAGKRLLWLSTSQGKASKEEVSSSSSGGGSGSSGIGGGGMHGAHEVFL